jgi:hypothetical protein
VPLTTGVASLTSVQASSQTPLRARGVMWKFFWALRTGRGLHSSPSSIHVRGEVQGTESGPIHKASSPRRRNRMERMANPQIIHMPNPFRMVRHVTCSSSATAFTASPNKGTGACAQQAVILCPVAPHSADCNIVEYDMCPTQEYSDQGGESLNGVVGNKRVTSNCDPGWTRYWSERQVFPAVDSRRQ